jgi:type VI secretion system protein ImpF
MARPKSPEILRASLLDRLAGSGGARRGDGAVGLREIQAAVTRDLEWLLNSRCWWPGDLEAFEQSARSQLAYGMPDLSAYSWTSEEDARSVARRIEEAIKLFEPRLVPRSIKVALLGRESVDDFRVRLRIDATLHVEPYTERVAFDTEVDIDTGQMSVRSSA